MSPVPAGAWPSTGDPGDGDVPFTFEHWRLTNTGGYVLVAALDPPVEADMLDELNGGGNGSVTFPYDDAEAVAIDRGDVVRCALYGSTVWALVVAQIDEVVHTTPGEEGARRVTVGGGAVGASLLGEARVYPSGGVGRVPAERERTFGWVAAGFDDSAWTAAVPITTVGGSSVGALMFVYPHRPVFQGWPDVSLLTAQGVWGTAQTIPDVVDAPQGFCLFRRTAVLAAGGEYLVVASMDDRGVLYLDGVEIMEFDSPDNFTNAHSKRLTMSAGSHVFAAYVETDFAGLAGGLTQDVGAFVMALHTIDGNGEALAEVAAFTTDADWKVLAYPAAIPGVTAGTALLTCLSEAQARGALPGVTATFTASLDSAGAAWSLEADITTRTGNDLTSFLSELVASGLVGRWRLDPATLELDVYTATVGTATGAAIDTAAGGDPDTGAITSLTRRTV